MKRPFFCQRSARMSCARVPDGLELPVVPDIMHDGLVLRSADGAALLHTQQGGRDGYDLETARDLKKRKAPQGAFQLVAGSEFFQALPRRATPIRPRRPVPNSHIAAGSGTTVAVTFTLSTFA